MKFEEIFNLAVKRHQARDLAEAERICRQILSQSPEEPRTLNLLGIIAFDQGHHEVAAEMMGRAAAADPTQVDYFLNLAQVLLKCKRWPETAAAYRKVLAFRPADVSALNNLGLALHYSGNLTEAAAAYRAALNLSPDNPSTLSNLGAVLSDPEEAVACYRKALELAPNLAQSHSNLAGALNVAGHFDEAEHLCRRALELQPDLAGAYYGLAHAKFNKAGIDEAIAAYLQAERLKPHNPNPGSNRLFALQFHPDYDAGHILREHLIWNQRFARPLGEGAAPHANDRTGDRRLRVGYSSPNLRMHSQAAFIHALLSQHDHQRVEIYCYSDGPASDAMTARLRRCADVWIDTIQLNDRQIAQRVRDDQIDILVDLTMHMERGRPLMFARKPAPVQVAWLAYPGTTGLSAMDYRFTDAYLDPPGVTDEYYAEKSVRLPRTFACFDPTALEAEIPLTPLPAMSNGYITFGSLNNFIKMNRRLLELWNRVLQTTPGSRLRLLAPQGEAREWVRKYIAGDRVDFVSRLPRPEYLAEYSRIDICLDTLPYNGHTTSLEAMWMGVPVVTRLGHTAAGRAGWSVMNNLQLTELAGQDDDAFVRIAVGLAGDLPRLQELRRTLRGRMLKSPLTDAAGFARNVEAAYRAMWATYIATP